MGGWSGSSRVDLIFILALAVLYALTRWLITAISRLGGIE